MTTYDILIPGYYFCDIIFTGIPDFPALGTEIYTDGLTVVPGGVMNTVTGLTRLGVRVGWLGALGNDFFSQFVAETARQEGIDISLNEALDRPFKRVTVALSYPDDRAFITHVDPAPDIIDLIYRHLDETPFKHLHFTGLLVDERVPALLRDCHARGIRVSMDCQHRDDTLDSPLVCDIITNLDMFMPNATEAQRLTRTSTLEAAASELNAIVPLLVIKDGKNGAHSWCQDEYLHAPGLANIETVDTTGAGDIFNAGFLAAYCAGKSLGECLQWGNIAGGLSLRGYGGYSAAPTLEELESWLRQVTDS